MSAETPIEWHQMRDWRLRLCIATVDADGRDPVFFADATRADLDKALESLGLITVSKALRDQTVAKLAELKAERDAAIAAMETYASLLRTYVNAIDGLFRPADAPDEPTAEERCEWLRDAVTAKESAQEVRDCGVRNNAEWEKRYKRLNEDYQARITQIRDSLAAKEAAEQREAAAWENQREWVGKARALEKELATIVERTAKAQRSADATNLRKLGGVPDWMVDYIYEAPLALLSTLPEADSSGGGEKKP